MSKHQYRSGFEHQIGADLDERGINFDYETETFVYQSTVRSGRCRECGGCKVAQVRKYTPDFIIENPSGKMYIEAKGILDSKTRSKMRDVMRSNPGIDLRFLFQGKATWMKSHAVIKWCEKYGFKYHFGHVIPEGWLET